MKFILSHVPKTGGKSFDLYIRTCLGLKDKDVFRLNNQKMARTIRGFDQTFIDATQLVYAQSLYCTFAGLPPEYKRVTILRDPVDRAVSQFGYFKHFRRDNLSVGRIIRDEHWTIDDFISPYNDVAMFYLFPLVLMFGCESYDHSTYEPDRLVETAKKVLDGFDFVGFTDRYREDMDRFANEFNMHGELTRENKTPSYKRITITDSQRKRYTDILEREYEVYNHIRRQYDQDSSRGGYKPQRRLEPCKESHWYRGHIRV